MVQYLLDSNILSDAIYEPHGQVAGRMERLQHLVCTSIVVAAELRFGAAKRGSRALAVRVESLLERVEVMPLLAPADRVYADLRASLQKSGKPIGANDMFIAAHALALGCTLVTDNVREFSRVKSLAVENWLR
jgi:tRNA(fMet)-specific endonuclease VapC